MGDVFSFHKKTSPPSKRIVVLILAMAYTFLKEGIDVLGLWLTTIGAMTIFFVMLYFFFKFIQAAVNSEDSYTVDQLPKDQPIYKETSQESP